MKQKNSQELLIQIGKLVIRIDEATDEYYYKEVEEYKDRLREHEICGSQKPSPQSLKLSELNISALNQKLSSLIKEFRSIKN